MTKTLSEMTMQQSQLLKLDSYMRKVNDLKMNSLLTDTEAHRRCNVARDMLFSSHLQENLIILQTPIHLKDILPTNASEKIPRHILADIGCGRYQKEDHEYVHTTEYLSANIQYCIANKKAVFIMLGLQEYCADPGTDSVTGKKQLEYSTHSTCLILLPFDDKYQAFYINSHGRDMDDTDLYKRIASSKRTHNVTFDMPAELLFVRELIDYWNSLLDFNDKKINIEWDTTERFTYWDTNLQCGDIHGMCFAFPQIILHTFGTNFDSTRECIEPWGKITLNSSQKLLKNGKLGVFVKSSFMEFDKKYEKYFIEELLDLKKRPSDIDGLQSILQMQRTLFIKKVVASIADYLSQISFHKKNFKVC
jgi:hypothetical protein